MRARDGIAFFAVAFWSVIVVTAALWLVIW